VRRDGASEFDAYASAVLILAVDLELVAVVDEAKYIVRQAFCR
jgi:hypothetical protein